MNTPFDPDERDATEREWRLQERALRPERGTDAIHDECEVARYRRVARALRREPGLRPPSNFAYSVAQLAERRARMAAVDARFERRMLRGLVAVMVLATIVFGALYGVAWVSTGVRLLDASGAGASGWVATLAACVLSGWAVEGVLHLRAKARP